MEEFKRIRIDFYRYRVRKGRPYCLLVKDETGKYSIPSHYVARNENIRSTGFDIEDDGDLVINDLQLNDCHFKVKGQEWVLLNDVASLPFNDGGAVKSAIKLLSKFIRHVHTEEEAVKEKMKALLDGILIEEARAAYRNEIQRVIDGGAICCGDAVMSQPDKELLKEEIRTLAHFKARKITRLKSFDFPFDYQWEPYTYEPVDWKAFGAEFSPVNFQNYPL